MGEWIYTGISLTGFVLLWISIVRMVIWYRSDPARGPLLWPRRPRSAVSRAETREITRQMYGSAWPLCSVAGIFLMGFGTVIDGDTTPWQIALNAFFGVLTVVVLIAYLRLRR